MTGSSSTIAETLPRSKHFRYSRAFRRALPYMAVYLAATFITFGKQFLYANRLGPIEYGQLTALLLYATMLMLFGDLGYSWVAQKGLPAALLNRDFSSADRMQHAAVLAFFSAAPAMAMMLVPLGMVTRITPGRLALVALFACGQQLFVIHAIRLRSSLHTTKYAVQMFLRAVVLAAAGLLAARHYGSGTSVLAAEATAAIANALVVSVRDGWLLRLISVEAVAAAKRAIFDSAKQAVALLSVNGSQLIVSSIDRWVALFVLSRHDLGIYAVGAAVLTAADVIQAMLNQYVFPVLARRLSTHALIAAYRLAWRVTALALVAGAVAAVLALGGVEWAIVNFMPRYLEATVVVRIVAAGALLRLANFLTGFCVLVNRERALIQANAATAVLVISLVVAYELSSTFTAESVAVLAVVAAALNIMSAAVIATRAASKTRHSQHGGADS